jgi:hypothetical protein
MAAWRKLDGCLCGIGASMSLCMAGQHFKEWS